MRVAASATAVEVATVKIGTRGSPLALAQAYMTRDLLKVRRLFDLALPSLRKQHGMVGCMLPCLATCCRPRQTG